MKIKVVSQERIVLEQENITSIMIPTSSGLIEVLPDHENMISVLELGELKVTFDKTVEIILIAGGMLYIENNEVLILSDQADLASELVANEIEQAIQLAQQKQESSEINPSELIRLEKQLMYERFKKKYIN